VIYRSFFILEICIAIFSISWRIFINEFFFSSIILLCWFCISASWFK